MTKAVKELIRAAKQAAMWMEAATCPNELNRQLRELESAIKKVEDEDRDGIKTGYLLLIELADGQRRVTATVESPENYFSRAGWKPELMKAEITYSEDVNDLDWARNDLKVLLPEERFGAGGMLWSESPREEFIAAMKLVAESVNNHS